MVKFRYPHFRLFVNVGDANPLQRWARTQVAVRKGTDCFGEITATKCTRWVRAKGDGTPIKQKMLILETGFYSNFGSDSGYKQVIHYCEFVRVVFMQKSVYLVLPDGNTFTHRG